MFVLVKCIMCNRYEIMYGIVLDMDDFIHKICNIYKFMYEFIQNAICMKLFIK